ncbi:hypothetical protein [Persicitalea sp.]|uniref:hypothetical protein n=1 Tax=Persicitalea sp. TaxID=3100273 RepID=UPI003593C590
MNYSIRSLCIDGGSNTRFYRYVQQLFHVFHGQCGHCGGIGKTRSHEGRIIGSEDSAYRFTKHRSGPPYPAQTAKL